MREVWERVRRALDTHAPGLSKTLRRGADEAALGAAEAALGVTLPDEVRESMRIHDGTSYYIVDGWEFEPVDRIVSLHAMFCEFVDDGTITLGDSNWVRTHGPVRPQKWNRRWISIASDGNGDHLALDLDPPPDGTLGQVIRIDRDVRDVYVIAPSLRAMLEGFADDLEQGRYDIERDPDRGTYITFRKRKSQ